MGNKKEKNRRVGVVYSTNDKYEYEYEEEDEADTLPKKDQRLRLHIDRKGRKGKEVTLIKGFVGTTSDKEALCKKLKTSCGAGGSVTEDGILVQGDHRDRMLDLLKKWGYQDVKKSGG